MLVGTWLILALTCLLLLLLERRKHDLSVPCCPGLCNFLVLRPLAWLDCKPVGILKSPCSLVAGK